MSSNLKIKLKIEYYRLVWNNKVRKIIRDLYIYFSRDRDEIESINLDFVTKINVVS